MKIAVVIPVYNGKGIVDDAIKALQKQTIKPHKIICVDDASPDNSAEYIRSKFPFVKVLKNKKNLGASGTYARGIKYAYDKGFDLVWLLDQDSIPFRDALEQLLKYYKKQPSAVYASTLIEKNSKIVIRMLSRDRIDYKKPYVAEICNFSGMLLSRKIIKHVGYPLKELGMDAADWEYCLRIKKYGYLIYIIPESKIYHNPGIPTRIKIPFKVSNVVFDENEQIYKIVQTKTLLMRSDTPERYYSRAKSPILIAKLPYASWFFRIFVVESMFSQIIKIIAYEKERKNEKIKAFIDGIIDGLQKNVI